MKIVKKYIVSSVIPNASVNEEFLSALELYSIEQQARIMLFCTRLRPKDYIVDADRISRYIVKRSVSLTSKLEISTIEQSHFSVNPLLGINFLKSCAIIPAPRLMLKSLPRQIKQKTLPRGLWTTGTICRAEGYDNTKRHVKAKEAHQKNGIGALVVEIYDNGRFNVRFLEWKENCFYDFVDMEKVMKYTSKKSYKSQKAEAIVFGDTHLQHADKTIMAQRDIILKNLQPNNVFHHDILDGSAEFINHHIINQIQKRIKSSKMSCSQELEQLSQYLLSQLKLHKKTNINIVASNHMEFYDRILEDEYRLKDVVNNLTKQMVDPKENRFETILDTIRVLKELFDYKFKNKNAIEEYCCKRYPELKKIKWLRRDESFIVKGKQLADHGDYGSNGSKGTHDGIKHSNPGSFVCGHTHTPCRDELGGQFVGTSERFDAEYCNASGYSSWAHCDVVMYKNGGTTHIFFLNNDIESKK